MSRTSLIMAIPRSFYSQAFYREVFQNWRGRGFIYLLFLLAICWLLITFVIVTQVSKVVEEEMNNVILQMPTLKISQGKASIKQYKPVFIKSKVDESVLAIIDIHGQYSKFKQSAAILLVQKDGVLVKQTKTQMKTYHFPQSFSGTFGPNELKEAFARIKQLVIPLVYIIIYTLGLAVIYIYLVLQSLIFALIGKTFTALSKQQIDYSALINLSLVIMTPAIVLYTISALTPVRIPYMSIYCLFISFGYLFFAIESQKKLSV